MLVRMRTGSPSGSTVRWKSFSPNINLLEGMSHLRDHAEMPGYSLNLWAASLPKVGATATSAQRLMPKPSDVVPVRDSLFAQKAKHSTNADARKASYLTPSILSKLREIYAHGLRDARC